MPKVNEEQNPGVPLGKVSKDSLSDAAPSFTPGPWEWTNAEVECGAPYGCTPEGCCGHDSGIPEYLGPVGITVTGSEESILDGDGSEGSAFYEQWKANAHLIAAAPELYEACATIIAWDSSVASKADGGLTLREQARLYDEAISKARAALAKVNAREQEK